MSGTVAVTYLRSTGHVWHGRTGKQERTKKQIDGSTATATNHNTRRARNYYHWEKNNAPRSATDTQRDRRRPCQQHSEYSAMTINYNANTSQQSTARYFTVQYTYVAALYEADAAAAAVNTYSLVLTCRTLSIRSTRSTCIAILLK